MVMPRLCPLVGAGVHTATGAPAHADPTAPLAVEELRALHAARRGHRLD